MGLLNFEKKVEINCKTNKKKKYSKLLLCKCKTTGKDFCIRLDRNAEEQFWKMAYTFKVNSSMKNESFSDVENEKLIIKGYSNEYAGCPYCDNFATDFCSCGTIFCEKGDGIGVLTCPVCGKTAEYTPGVEYNVKGVSF